MQMNRLVLMGRLIANPEWADIGSYKAVRLLLAVSRFNRKSKERIDDTFEILCWQKMGEHAIAELHANDTVCVEAHLVSKPYQREGTTKVLYYYSINADKLQSVSGGKNGMLDPSLEQAIKEQRAEDVERLDENNIF